jgi:murein DD-endopeptidase MepM/ murein hydrolase activator NlpD
VRRATPILLILLLAVPVTASAEVTREQVDAAEAEVREISARLESELTELDQAIGLEDSYRYRIAAIEAEMTSRDRQIALTVLAARERARAMYVTAGAQRFHTMLNVDEFGQIGTRTAYLDALADQDLDVVNELEFLQNDRDRLQEELDLLLDEQEIEVGRLERTSDAIYAELETANAEYQVVRQEWEKQEEERRRREAAAAAAAAAAASNYSSSAGTSAAGRTCPVAGAHSFRDSWGEPRSGGRSHHGVDMIAPRGTPLVAIEVGTITSTGFHYAGGNGLYLRGDSGDIYYYAHMDGYAGGIGAGVRVNKGQTIGYVGDTGNATGTPHLHLGYQPGGGPLTNPYQLMVKLCR